MLANRLNVLLAERQLTNKQVVDDTGISRNTISNIVNNPGANISTDTIDRLCRYLGVKPADFFIYTEYDFELSFLVGGDVLEFNVFYHENERAYRMRVDTGDNSYFQEMGYPLVSGKYDLQVKLSSADNISEDDELANIYKGLPVIFQTRLNNLTVQTLENLIDSNKNLSEEFGIGFDTGNLSVLLRLPWGKLSRKFNTKTKKFS